MDSMPRRSLRYSDTAIRSFSAVSQHCALCPHNPEYSQSAPDADDGCVTGVTGCQLAAGQAEGSEEMTEKQYDYRNGYGGKIPRAQIFA
jgi:hypothetical protein